MSFKTGVIATLERLLYNRWPLIGGVIRREATVMLIEDGSPEAVKVLTQALVQNDDPIVCDVIWANMEWLLNRNRTRTLRARWRPEILTDWTLSEQRGWVRLPRMEDEARDALKAGDLDKLKSSGPAWIGPLLAVCDDPDRKVRTNLEKVLRNLEKPETREALCRSLIEKDCPMARAIVIEMAMAPEDLVARALFFFLTGQWNRYDALDFDQRLLRAAYAAENAVVRRRIRERLRITGRSELLTVVIGQESSSRVTEMAPDELEFVVGMLRLSREWNRLWAMVFETPLPWSVRILEILSSADWQPPEAERALFAELRALLEAGLLLDPEAFSREFPRILLQSQLRAPGRINDVVFASHRPLLGIGTGSRTVALWNYQTAQCERVLDGFQHSVGQVAFTEGGGFVCAERPHRTKAPSGIYSWDGQRLRRLGEHQGQVTALEVVSGSTVLSAGRDGAIALWDVASGQLLMRHTMPDWPRALRVTPSGDSMMVLIHREVQWLNLSDMSMISRAASATMPTCVAFLPLQPPMPLIGRRDGSVTLYRRNSPWLRRERDLCTHALAVQGIEVLPKRGYILTAGHEGEVRFFDLVKREQMDWVAVSGKGLTTLHVSPDEAFMAVGHADAAFSLWDLRGPEVAAFLGTPLAFVPPLALGLLDAFANNPKLKETVRRTLTCMSLIVRHRVRFDIEIDFAAPSIMAGEFDIEI